MLKIHTIEPMRQKETTTEDYYNTDQTAEELENLQAKEMEG